MAETLVIDEVCSSCGKEARPHALFCYHCGGSLEPVGNENDEPSSVWFRGEIAENKDTKEKNEDSKDIEEVAEEKAESQQEDSLPNIDEGKEEDESFEDENDSIEVDDVEAKDSKQDSKDEEVDDLDEKIQKPDDNKLEELLEEKKEDKEEKVKVKPKPFKEKEDEKPKLDKNTKLKTASALRRKGKPDRLKKIEINWQEQDDSPNMWFIIFGIVFTLFVTGLVFLAFYLK